MAGVSVGTASKALNGQGKLRQETIERVMEAADRLGFAPNTLAQALLAGRTFTVGLITTDSFGRFSIPVMLGAEDALGTGEVSVFMCDARDDPERERRYVEMLWARRVDGLIVTGRRIEPRPPVRALHGIPVVYAMTQPEGGGAPACCPTTRAAAGPPPSTCWPSAAAGSRTSPALSGSSRPGCGRGVHRGTRRAGHRAMRRHQLRRVERALGPGSGRAAAGDDRPDAIFCGSDQIARGVADTLRAVGRRIPDDVALVGFDNWAPMAMGALPPLTSVDMCLEEVGRVAAERLLAAIAEKQEQGAPTVYTVPPRLVVRESTGGYSPKDGG